MARALIVGCGCSGRALGAELLDEGWAVRGLSRDAEGLEAIEAAGIEPARADPERPATILELVDDVAVLIWLLGSATGPDDEVAAIHGPRLEGLLERLVETPVRGFVYEGAGSVDAALLAGGAELVRQAESTWRIPVAITETSREHGPRWVEEMETAVLELLSHRG
ncbi:MAG TPA: NAD(P)H-binding protein [Solirubrobacterales bacterium]|nr:NAD(P)H-binding protein [Solirubrobacterales bacterium]